jgi:hypothetical protein
MSYIDAAFGEIEENRDKKLRGGYNSIPFGLKRLEEYVPGVQKSNYVILTANSGVGKSKFAKNMFVFRPHDFVIANPHLNIKMTTLYFCLEEPSKSFAQSLMCYKLNSLFKERMSIKELRSQLRPEDPTAVISSSSIANLRSIDKYFREFESQVILIDDVRKPYAIYKRCLEYLHEIGDFTMKEKEYYNPKEGKMVRGLVRDKFFTEHPDHYIQIVIDHMSLLEPEKGQDLFEAMRVMSSTYLVNLRNTYHCSVLGVQQQSSEKEKQQYTYKGASIESKLEPSLDGLGDCKLTQRDADEIYGIFAPDRYEIADHRGYDITRLGDNYRSFSFLKQRDGASNKRLGFFFDGASNYIAELPPHKSMTSAHYDKVLKMSGRSK